MIPRRIFALCPDYEPAAGGIRKLYRHVDVLNRQGFAATILHQRLGFRCTWFANTTRVAYLADTALAPADFLVVPELYGPQLATLAPGVPKVIFNQNSYLTFQGYSLDPSDLRAPYTSPEVVATLTVSQDNADYLRYAFPQLRLFCLHYGIDPTLFFAPPAKRPFVGFMPRKNAADVVQVINLLKQRRALAGFDLVPIHNRSEAEAAALLRDCAVFLSFGHPEGCPLPPLEAMACGCVVIGYHGYGGREYFRPEFSYPVPVGDIVTFARTVEGVLQAYRNDPAPLQRQGAQAAAFVREHYSPASEEQDIVSFWRGLLADTSASPFGANSANREQYHVSATKD